MAIITFRSRAAGEIYMFRETAEEIFKVFGKPLGIRGVITPEEIPAALKALQVRIEKEKELLKEVKAKEDKAFREGKDLDKEKKPRWNKLSILLKELTPLLKCLNALLKKMLLLLGEFRRE